MLEEILDGRRAALVQRVEAGLATPEQARMIGDIIARTHIWIAVTTNEDKEKVQAALASTHYAVKAFSVADISSELEKLGTRAS